VPGLAARPRRGTDPDRGARGEERRQSPFLLFQTPDVPSRYSPTPLAASRTCRISPAKTSRSSPDGPATTSAPLGAPNRLLLSARQLEADLEAARELPLRPARDVEVPSAQCLDPSLESRQELIEELGAIDRSTAGGLAQRCHVAAQLGGKSLPGPVRVDADPDDHPGIRGADAVGLAEEPRELPDLHACC
jgi:hypothetical protein